MEIDGMWEVERVTIRNKYNGRELELDKEEWEKIRNGTSVSKIYHEKLTSSGAYNPNKFFCTEKGLKWQY